MKSRERQQKHMSEVFVISTFLFHFWFFFIGSCEFELPPCVISLAPNFVLTYFLYAVIGKYITYYMLYAINIKYVIALFNCFLGQLREKVLYFRIA